MSCFSESTQCANWRFTADRLRSLREENLQRSLDALEQARTRSASVASLDTLDSDPAASAGAPAVPAAAAGEPPLGLEEEAALLKYYGSRLQHVCRELRLPRRVLGTAITYLKRIYLAHSCLEHDPQQLLLTCLYLACKIEEHYISAAELGRLTGVPPELILRTELTALQALRFDLIVYSPYKPIDGFFEDVKEAAADAAAAAPAGDVASAAAAAAEAAAGLDPGMAALSAEQLDKARAGAYSAADALMLSDAPLLHTPGRLALAALRSGFSKVGIKLQRYVQRVARKGSSGSGSVADGDAAAVAQQLQAALAELDRLGAEGARSVEQATVAAFDCRLKACRSQLAEGCGAQSAAAAKAKAKADKAARKAAKVVEQRRAAEAAVGILPDAPAAPQGTTGAAVGAAAEEPPAKRVRQSNE